MDCSMPGFPVHHQLQELAQTHVHWVGDAIQPSLPLLSPSPSAFNLFQHQGFFPVSQFFTSGGQSIGVSASAPVLPMNIQDWFPLGLIGLISLQSKGLSRVFSRIQKHEFFWSPSSLLTFKGNTLVVTYNWSRYKHIVTHISTQSSFLARKNGKMSIVPATNSVSHKTGLRKIFTCYVLAS